MEITVGNYASEKKDRNRPKAQQRLPIEHSENMQLNLSNWSN
jgi:hypothetical protein